MIIGLPRALEFYRNEYLWQTFFSELKIKTILSPETNTVLLKNGINNSIDECCLPTKIYMGHVHYLIDKCDFILIPRIKNFGKNESVCVKFNAMYDIVNNTFKTNLLDYNIQVTENFTEIKGFLNIGERLGFSKTKSMSAYLKAKEVQKKYNENGNLNQLQKLKTGNLKILVVSHKYNICDKIIGEPIIKYIFSLGAEVILANEFSHTDCSDASKKLSGSLYWTYNKQLVGAIELYKDYVDGIIFITAFPCGPDSLVNELMIRKVKSLPIINLIVDELSAEGGLQTRIESFIDIIDQRKNRSQTIKTNQKEKKII